MDLKAGGVSSGYMKQLQAIVAEGGPSLCETVFKFHLQDDEPNPFSCRVTQHAIDQQPETAHSSRIFVEAQLTTETYALMVKRKEDLRATVSMTYRQNGVKADPIIRKYYVMVAAVDDNVHTPINVNVNAESIQEPLKTVMFELMEGEFYRARAVSFSVIFKNCTMEQCIQTLISNFGIEKRQVVVPDNGAVYDQVAIPAGQSMATVFNYLQKTYGVYTGGLAHFYADGVFYVYPPYARSDSQTKTWVNIYHVRAGTLSGATTFYRKRDTSLDIIVNGNMTVINTQEQDTGDNGTHSIMLLGSSILEKFTTRLNSGAVLTAANSFLSVKNLKAINLVGSVLRQEQFTKVTDNAFTATSAYAKSAAQTVMVTWAGSQPFLVEPGTTVNFIYETFDSDGSKTIRRAKGMILGIRYQGEFMRSTVSDSGQVVGYGATITLRLEDLQS